MKSEDLEFSKVEDIMSTSTNVCVRPTNITLWKIEPLFKHVLLIEPKSKVCDVHALTIYPVKIKV